MKKMMKRLRNERGLTLVELLAVVVILAIIGTIAFVMIGNVIENSKKDAHIANAQQLISAAKLYEANGGEIGDDGVSSGELEDDGYLEPLVDPWEKKATDSYSGTVNKTSDNAYEVTLTGGKSCDIDGESESDVLQGREAVCNGD